MVGETKKQLWDQKRTINLKNVFIMIEVTVGMERTVKIYILTKFAPIQTALMKSVYLDTPILADLAIDAYST